MTIPSPAPLSNTVLIIEDSPVVQHLIKASLQPLGVSILLAADGEAGVESARTHLPDLITLDIGLPGIDGWEVLTQLRSNVETAQIPVIVVTAHGEEDVTAGQRAVEGFVTKPFRPADLQTKVANLLDSEGPVSAVG